MERDPDLERSIREESNLALARGSGFAILLVLLNLPLLTGGFAGFFAFLPDAVWAGEWWRLVTPPFVHVSPYHLLLDAAACFTAYAELRQRRGLERLGFVAAVGVFAAVQLWRGHARWK